MPAFDEAEVSEIVSERKGLQRILVTRSADAEAAYVLTDLIGSVAVGDRVIINTTAVDLGLGTGGSHVVHWNLSRTSWSSSTNRHVMKLRYSSLQTDVGVEEEVEGYEAPTTLDAMPVVACFLHSQVAAVAAAVKHVKPTARIAFVMTDQASLPLVISDLMAELRERGIIDTTVTTGQAFGGDHEAVNVASGLAIAKGQAHADVVIVGPGPGVVGTSTELGFGGLETVGVLDAIHASGGTPILAMRWSDADKRERHRGLSHHTKTVLKRTTAPVITAVPKGREVELLAPSTQFVEVPDVAKLLAGLNVTSMGRSVTEDPGLFEFAAAAGLIAARVLS